MADMCTIRSVIPLGGKGKRYELSVTQIPFHPSGGGQPGDSGELRSDGFLFRVQNTEKAPDGLLLSGELVRGTLEPGMIVEAFVDAEQHRIFSRMHTGEHILSRILESTHEGLHVHKVSIGSEESALYLTYQGEVHWDMVLHAEDEGNRVIGEDMPVVTENYSRKEAENLAGLKANWERIETETIRVVRIPGFDTIACSGSHVSSTGEVGDLFVTGFTGSPPEWEVKFTVEGKTARSKYSAVARRIVRRIGCPLSKTEDFLAHLQEENRTLTKVLERAAPFISPPWETRLLSGIPLYVAVLPGFPKNLVTASARKWSDDHPEAIVLTLLPGGTGGGEFLLYVGRAVGRDFSSFLRQSPALHARGGGRADWLNGQSETMTMEVWQKEIEGYLRQKDG